MCGGGFGPRCFDLAVKNTTEKVFLNDELWRSGVRILFIPAHQKVILRMKCVEWLFIMSGDSNPGGSCKHERNAKGELSLLAHQLNSGGSLLL